MTGDASFEALGFRLGYLFKHVHLRLAEASALALAPFGVDGRELAVLVVLAAKDPLSQLEAAGRLGVDRTTMVALVDALEVKGLVERRRSSQDRRKNIVQLTPTGQDCLRKGEQARAEMERQFLAPLAPSDADRLVRSLQTLATAPATSPAAVPEDAG
ncbi:DNA-binding MarR family transcriptional regulator [Kitasatospora sp. MAA4]|uniref:MarR family winged helix-turn-helix transcriptional regulator n=1 Tax=Kitasatospora sp. MAA4 TaxID=3035093 RepID=UPI002475E676|nr:MarR family winged helix-turn-helix transcriptional regulator [Kitasatospora sp. MAA4]MDH6135719.1 DNA-binding MarR family transcriptional regulator [Kitasatospora sp. MAA4]